MVDSPDPWKHGEMTRELKTVFERSVSLNEFASQKEKYNFQSLLLAFTFCNDVTSIWFQEYIRDRDEYKNLRIFFASGKSTEELDRLRGTAVSDILPDSLESSSWTSSARLVVERAIQLERNTSSNQSPLDVRHLMGGYVYYKAQYSGDDHEVRLKKWGFDRLEWSNEFLKHIALHFKSELNEWKKIHIDLFKVPPIEIAESPPDVKQTTVQGGASSHISSDKWTVDDVLGYRSYAYAIARFLTHEKTKPPISIGIQAPWGGGKSSLMRMVRQQLDKTGSDESIVEGPHPRKQYEIQEESSKSSTFGVKKLFTLKHESMNGEVKLKTTELKTVLSTKLGEKFSTLKIQGNEEQEVKPRITIWFNAWEYQSTGQIWAGLADSIVYQVANRLDETERLRFLYELHQRRQGTNKMDRTIKDLTEKYSSTKTKTLTRGSAIGLGLSVLLAIISQVSNSSFVLPFIGSGIASTIVLAASQTVVQQYIATRRPAEDSLGEFVQVPNYTIKKVESITDVEEDLQSVMAKIPNQYLPMVIFVDDLDRCSPNKVADVIEAMNIFIGGNHFRDCMFVLGMDAEMVVASLQNAYSNIILKLPQYSTHPPIGWRFMDKFVQLPFIIPTSEKGDLDMYIKTLFYQEGSKAINYKKVKEAAIEASQITPHTVDEVDKVTQNVGGKHGLKSEQELEFLNYQIRERSNIIDLKDRINKFSDEDPAILNQILNLAPQFLNNPRDLKRFMNVFRFQYFLLLARRSRGQKVPSVGQLMRWIILSLKWPDVVQWLQWTHGVSGYGIEYKLDSGEKTFLTGYRLGILEKLGESSEDLNEWVKKAKTELDLKVETAPWIADDDLRKFFAREGSLQQIDRLSAYTGRSSY